MAYTNANDILSQFVPGQVNAKVAQAVQSGVTLPRQPASDLPTLKLQLNKGLINRQQFITKMASLNPTQPGKYSLGNVAGAFKDAIPQVVSPFVTSERTVATGVARSLPGGTNDLKAQQQASASSSQTLANAKNLYKQGKISFPAYVNLVRTSANNSTDIANQTRSTVKGLPTTGQLASGFAGTAADILTGGELPALKGIKGAKIATQALHAGSFGAAGGLNAAASGGTKKDIAKNFVAGAAFPLAGKVASKLTSDTPLGRALTRVQAQRSAGINVPKSALDNHIVEDKGGALPTSPKSPEIKSTPVTQNKSQIEAGKGIVQNTNSPEQVSKAYFSNVPKATEDYQTHVMKEFGTSTPNVASADSAKFIVRGGEKMNPADAGPFHEEASQFTKNYYKNLLNDPATKDKPVLITGGGAGAGKTSGLSILKNEGKSLNDYAAVNDTNLTSLKSATDRIDPALASGRKVELIYTYRHPVEAFTNGQIPRAERTGRIVPIDQHVDTHVGSLEAIQQVAEKYKDNPNVTIRVADNSRGRGKQAEVGLDFLKDKVYDKNNLKKELLHELQKAKEAGTISPETHAGYNGSNPPEPKKQDQQDNQAGRIERTDSGLGQPNPQEVGTSKIGKSVQTQAVQRGLEDTFGDSATYNKVNIKDQAQKAVDLTQDREALDKVISGEKPLPDGLRATSVITAVEKDPILSKDSELILKLSQSNLASESSYSAQELRLAAERNPDSPIAKIQEVSKARADAVKRKGQTTASVASDIQKEVKARTPKVSRQDWHSFVQELRCK